MKIKRNKEHENYVVFLAVTESDHSSWKSSGKMPNEWEAVPQWKTKYGDYGVPRNLVVEREDGEKYGFTLEYVDRERLNILFII